MADGPATRAIRIGLSACLLGERVRYDGGHKRDELLVGWLSAHAVLVPVCPEVELGLGTPRPPIRLVGRGGAARLVEPRGGVDHTDAMAAFAERRLGELGREALCGFVLKSGSPSCGLAGVEEWPASSGAATLTGTGLFARALRARWPLLPVVEAEALRDPAAREAFLARARAWRHAGVAPGPTRR